MNSQPSTSSSDTSPVAAGGSARGAGRGLVVVGHGDAELGGPRQQRLGLRRHHLGAGHLPGEHLAGRAVDREDLADGVPGVADDDGVVLDAHLRRPHDGGDAPAAGDDGGVAGEPAAAGEDAGRLGHRRHVLGRGLGADQDHPAGRRPPAASAAAGDVTISPVARPGEAGEPPGERRDVAGAAGRDRGRVGRGAAAPGARPARGRAGSPGPRPCRRPCAGPRAGCACRGAPAASRGCRPRW